MPIDLAALLGPRQLEALQEVAFELEDDHLLSFLLAAGTPQFRGAPAQTRARRRSRDLSPVERERAQEILDELQGEDLVGLRLPAVISRQEMFELLAAVKEVHERDYVIIRLLYATGCRRSELEKMRLADLCLQEEKIFVRDGKGDKDRYVLVDKTTAKLLDDFTYGRALDDPVFDIQDRQINRRVVHWAQQTGITLRYEAHILTAYFRGEIRSPSPIDPQRIQNIENQLTQALEYLGTLHRQDPENYPRPEWLPEPAPRSFLSRGLLQSDPSE